MTAGTRRVLWAAPVVLLAAIVAFYPYLLRAAGRFLNSSEPPAPADAVVVLAGDAHGNRIMKGCDLVRQGYAPIALVSGPSGNYGYHESELAIAFAVKQGCRPEWFAAVPNQCKSTRDEAVMFNSELRRRGVRQYLLVTSTYHTRRAGRLFRTEIPGLGVRVVAARDVEFDPDTWWHSREARKIFVFEWIKTVTEQFGV